MFTFFQKYLAQFDVEQILMNCLSLFILYLIFLGIKKLIKISIKHALEASSLKTGRDAGRQKTIIRLVENVLNYALYFFLIYSILAIFGLPVSSLLAGAGIAGVAIGLGAQGFLSDLVNGFFILVERQFDVGDSVQLSNGPIVVTGSISSLGIRTTQVRDADGTLHFIPNRNILLVSNKSRGNMRAQIDLPLLATVDLDQVADIIETVNQRELGNYEQIQSCSIKGAQTLPSGQFVFRVHLFVSNGQQSTIYPIFYGLYQKALLEAGISLIATPYGTDRKK